MANNDKTAALKRARRANIEAKSAAKVANDARRANYLHEVVWNHPVVADFLGRAGIVFREGQPPDGMGPEYAPIVAVLADDYGLPALPVPKRERLVALIEERAGWLIGKRVKASALAEEIEVMLSQGPTPAAAREEGDAASRPSAEVPTP